MRRPLLHAEPSREPPPSPTLSPNDHVRLLVELLRPLGPELARRWLACLMIVDEADREDLVAAIEKRVVETYGLEKDAAASTPVPIPPDVTLVGKPVQKSGFVERVDTTYTVAEGSKPSAKQRRKQG